MSVAPSFADIRAQLEAELLAQRSDLSVNDGDVTDAMLDAASVGADVSIRYAAQAFRDTFIDGAKGDALTTLVDDHFNIQRKAATAATVPLTFSRASFAGGAGTIAAGTQVGTAFGPDGKQTVFLTDANAVVGPTALTVSTTATAQDAGRGGNVKAGTVVQVISTLFDTFTVANGGAAAGGNDEESDEELRQRARAQRNALQRGTLDALEYGALQVPSVRVAKAYENPVTFDVQVRVGDGDGGSSLQMVSDVDAELEHWRVAGQDIPVIGGQRVLVDLTIEVRVREGFDLDAYSDLMKSAVEARIDKLKTGETMFLDPLVGAICAVSPDDVEDVAFPVIIVGGASFYGDATPASYQTLRHGTITIQAMPPTS